MSTRPDPVPAVLTACNRPERSKRSTELMCRRRQLAAPARVRRLGRSATVSTAHSGSLLTSCMVTSIRTYAAARLSMGARPIKRNPLLVMHLTSSSSTDVEVGSLPLRNPSHVPGMGVSVGDRG